MCHITGIASRNHNYSAKMIGMADFTTIQNTIDKKNSAEGIVNPYAIDCTAV